MISLVCDFIAAAAHWLSPKRVTPPATPCPAVDGDAQPAGAGAQSFGLTGSAAGTGGQPNSPTSWLLEQADDLLGYSEQNHVVRFLRAQLRDRAAYFRAVIND